jgi:uncharacterized membrane protein
MAFTGHIHPLLVHFPIGLILMAAAAEAIATVTGRADWRTVALTNLRAGAVVAVAATVSGWLLAASTAVDDASSLAWHRWIGTAAAIVALGAAWAGTTATRRSPAARRVYRAALFGAAALVAVTGHLGGLLVWGADFLRP